MRLTSILFRRNRMPKGHIFRGKDRLVKPVTGRDIRNLEKDFAVEEKNMFYLRFPYLTEAENHGHTKELGKSLETFKQIIHKQRRIFKEDVTLYERLGHLRVSERWE